MLYDRRDRYPIPCPIEFSHQPFLGSMASSTASSQAHGTETDDIQAAIAKTAELRSLHAKLLQRRNLGGGPFVLGPLAGAASFLRHSNPHSTAEDYPVFTPVRNSMPFSLPFYPNFLAIIHSRFVVRLELGGFVLLACAILVQWRRIVAILV